MDLDLVEPFSIKDMNFLPFYQIYKQDLNESLAYPNIFDDEFKRHLDLSFKQVSANWTNQTTWSDAIHNEDKIKAK